MARSESISQPAAETGLLPDEWNWNAAHCMQAATRFHPTVTGAIYSRYKRFGDLAMDESFFPVIWSETRAPSAFIEPYLAGATGWAGQVSPGADGGS